jgi:hypothetical protein
MAFKSVHEEMAAKNPTTLPLRRQAGHKNVGETRPTLTLAQGALAPSRPPFPASRNKGLTFSLENALTPGFKYP